MRLCIEVHENTLIEHYNSLSFIICNVLCVSAMQFHCGFLLHGGGVAESLNDRSKPLKVFYNISGMLHKVFHHC